MRFTTLLLASVLLSGTALAQTVSPMTGSNGTPAGPSGSSVPPAATPPTTAAPAPSAPAGTSAPAGRATRSRRSLAARFDAANTTHDGHLTLEQARAGRMRAVVRDFAKIDKDHRGYVTMDDIRNYRRERRAAARANRSTGSTTQ